MDTTIIPESLDPPTVAFMVSVGTYCLVKLGKEAWELVQRARGNGVHRVELVSHQADALFEARNGVRSLCKMDDGVGPDGIPIIFKARAASMEGLALQRQTLEVLQRMEHLEQKRACVVPDIVERAVKAIHAAANAKEADHGE